MAEPAKRDRPSGNEPSNPKWDARDLKEAEESTFTYKPDFNSSSTAAGKQVYSDKPNESKAGGSTSSSTAPGAVSFSDTASEDTEQSFFTPTSTSTKDNARFKIFGRRRRAIAGGGVLGAIVGSVFLFSYLSGPLQFIHIAQLLQQAHFSGLQSQSDDRGLRLARYAHYRNMGNIEKVRLGYMGNHFADKIETSFKNVGIESSYTEIFGFRDGLIIDPEKLSSGSSFGELGNKSPEQIKAYFKESFGATVTTSVAGKDLPGRSFFIDTSNLSYRQNQSITKAAMATAGISKKYSAIGARIMGERAGVTWHPIKAVDNKILATVEARYTEWRKNQVKTINTGAPADIRITDQSQDPNDTAQQKQDKANRAAAANTEAQAALSEGDATAKALASGEDATPKFTEHISVKIAGGGVASGVAIAGILCTVRALGENVDNIKQNEIVLPLIRYSVQYMSVGSQVMSGQGVDMEQLSFYSKQLSGKDSTGNTSSWTQARPFQAMSGQSQSGPPPSDTLSSIGKGNPFEVLSTGKVGGLLGAVCSKPALAAQTVFGFLGGPVTATLTEAVSLIAGPPLFDKIAHWLSNDPANVFAVGADAGYNMMYGGKLAANAEATSAGGRPLSSAEDAKIAAIENADYQKDYAAKSLAYKLFNPYDRRTPISTLIDQGGSSPSQNFAKMGSFFMDFGDIFSSVSKMFAPKVQAAAPAVYDYGFPTTGFSIDEMSNPKVANPYLNADQVVSTILPAHPEYIARAEKCFGVTIDPPSYDITSWQASTPEYKSSDLLSDDCRDSSSDWLQTRFYIFDTQTMEAAGCYNGDVSDDMAAQACSDIGFAASSTAPSDTTTGTGGAVATGTNVELAQKILNYQKEGKYNCDNPGDCADLQKIVNGQSLAGSNGCIAKTLDSRVLKLIIYVIENGNFKVGTYALCGDHSSDGPNGHSGGLAVDFSTVNGVAVVANSPQARTNTLQLATFLNRLSGELKLRQLITAGYGGKFDQAFLDLELPSSATFGGTGASSTNADHTNHIHAGY